MGNTMQPNNSKCLLVLRLFGPLDVRLNGAPLPCLRTRKHPWLLALLALLTLGIKTWMEWDQAREFAKAQAAPMAEPERLSA